MTQRTIKVGQDFMVDSPVPVHDGAGKPFYAVQFVDRANHNKKYCVVACERTPGTLTEVLRVDAMIGAPSIVIRPDGSAYVEGGGKDNTIVTGVDIPGFVSLLMPAAVLHNVDVLAHTVAALSATISRLTVQLAGALERIGKLEAK